MRQSLLEYCTAEGRFRPLLDEWDAARNLPLTPQSVTHGSHAQVWWRCAHGHSWRAAVKSRVSGCGCPVCAGRQLLPGENDLATLFPELAAQWDPDRNGPLTPRDVPPGTKKKVWWRCAHGHRWSAPVCARTRSRSGCPVCAGTQQRPRPPAQPTPRPPIACPHPQETK